MQRFSLTGKKIWVAGHRGMVGSALVRALASQSNCRILTLDRETADLRDQAATTKWLLAEKPDAIFLAAAKVGGILANATFPADYLYDNLMIEANVIHAAHMAGVSKLMLLGSSCIYPKYADQPIPESALLTGPLETSNEAYAIAKIAGIKLCQAYRRQHGRDFISAMPTNLYGPGDNFDLATSHVLPALMRKCDEAKTRGTPAVAVWGSGTPRREFMHVDDLANALVFLMENYSDSEPINVGVGADMAISELADVIKDIVGYDGAVQFDPSKPDGTPRKLMDSSRLNALGWRPSITLHDGITATYAWYLANKKILRAA
jgi:GDP-L-fucose synthase